MAEVSVILPTYDRLLLLEQAIASVQAQEHADWELIIVDDGSGDGTADFVARLGDARCRLVGLAHGGNVARARNAGLEVARARYVAFLDSDDVWLPRKLASQLAAMRETGARWSYTNYALVDLDGNAVKPRSGVWRPLAGRIVRQVFTMEANVAIPTVMAERGLLEGIGRFDEDPAMILREDYELVLRLAAAAEVAVVDEPLLLVPEHAARSTRALADPFERTARAYEVFAGRCSDRELARIARRQRAHYLAEAAAQRLGRGEVRRAGRHYLAALRAGDSMRHWLSAAGRGMRAAAAAALSPARPQ